MILEINSQKCNGCTICLSKCSYQAIQILGRKAFVDESKCTLCGICINACPQKAISKSCFSNDVSNGHIINPGICIFIEVSDGKLQNSSLELLSISKKLNITLNSGIEAILVGSNIKNLAAQVLAYGADKVWVIDNPEAISYQEDVIIRLLTLALKKIKPAIFLGSATVLGRSVFPRIAVKLETGLTADCTELDIDEKTNKLVQVRPAFGGNLMAKILTPHYRPQMATIRPGVFELPEIENTNTGEIEFLKDISAPGSDFELISDERQITNAVNLSDAEIIVSAGLGIQHPKNLELIRQFAGFLGGAFGVTRGVVEAGWIDSTYQIGLTGKTVRPKIYIACGISGAIQHQVGIRNSDTIIAINNDPNAMIFDIADYGIVHDLFEVIPAIVEDLKDKKICNQGFDFPTKL